MKIRAKDGTEIDLTELRRQIEAGLKFWKTTDLSVPVWNAICAIDALQAVLSVPRRDYLDHAPGRSRSDAPPAITRGYNSAITDVQLAAGLVDEEDAAEVVS